jgi:hypothetical protein
MCSMKIGNSPASGENAGAHRTVPGPGQTQAFRFQHLEQALFYRTAWDSVAVTGREERAVLCTAWLTANYFIQPLNDERQLFVGCF